MPDSRNQLMYLCGGEMDAGEFSLRITADDLDPNQITQLLGCQPTSSHRRGDTFGKRGYSYKFGQWMLSTERLDFRTGKCCEEAFDEFVRSLPDSPTAWNRIAADYNAQVYICVWIRTWNRDFDISAFALGELARRKLQIHIDTYLESDDED